MKPTRPSEGATVDLLDVLLRDGVVLSADVVVTVADVPLVGIQLRAAIAGMATMTDYGLLTDLDERRRVSIGASAGATATTRTADGEDGDDARSRVDEDG